MEDNIQCKQYEIWDVRLQEPLCDIPCVVIQNDKGNFFSSTTIVVPILDKAIKNSLYIVIDYNGSTKYIAFSLLRQISKERFLSNKAIDVITNNELRDKIRSMYFGVAGLKVNYNKGNREISELSKNEINDLYCGKHIPYKIH